MRFRREVIDQLLIVSHSTAESLQFGQQAIIKPATASQPATVGREAYARNDHKVQLVPGEERSGRRRFGDPERADREGDAGVPRTHRSGTVTTGAGVKAGEGDRHPILRRGFPQGQDIRFGACRIEEEYAASAFPFGKPTETAAECGGMASASCFSDG
jgi:hypothetical protein